MNQSVILAANGQNVIVLDQTGAFAPDELRKHLSDALISEYFCYWELGKQGLPVNILSLENCDMLDDKKDRLFSILSVAAKITGEVQGKVLKRHLSKIVKAIEMGKIKTPSDIVKFFDESVFPGHDDPELANIVDRFRDVFEGMKELPSYDQDWEEFLNARKKIIVISTSADGVRKDTQKTEILLTDLYHWKQHHKAQRMTVVVDEIEDLSLEEKGPISTILRKGGKNNLSMLLSTQEHSIDSDLLGKLVGNCGMLIFFRPKDANLGETAKFIGCDQEELEALEQGEMIAQGSFYNRSRGKNIAMTLRGKTYSAAKYMNPEPPTEPETDKNMLEAETPEDVEPEIITPVHPSTIDIVPETELPDDMEVEHIESMICRADDVIRESETPEDAEAGAVDTTMPESSDIVDDDTAERELQRLFRSVKSEFNPDNPCWATMLTALFEQIMDRHHFSCPADRENMKKRLERFMHLSPDCSGYEKYLDSLFKGLWP